MGKKFQDFTEAEFLAFMEQLRAANKSEPDDVLGELLDQFCEITEHPDGTDLIYWPEDGADNSSRGITDTVKKWRQANGLPGFKE